jgi:hypothetical protein
MLTYILLFNLQVTVIVLCPDNVIDEEVQVCDGFEYSFK